MVIVGHVQLQNYRHCGQHNHALPIANDKSPAFQEATVCPKTEPNSPEVDAQVPPLAGFEQGCEVENNSTPQPGCNDATVISKLHETSDDQLSGHGQQVGSKFGGVGPGSDAGHEEIVDLSARSKDAFGSQTNHNMQSGRKPPSLGPKNHYTARVRASQIAEPAIVILDDEGQSEKRNDIERLVAIRNGATANNLGAPAQSNEVPLSQNEDIRNDDDDEKSQQSAKAKLEEQHRCCVQAPHSLLGQDGGVYQVPGDALQARQGVEQSTPSQDQQPEQDAGMQQYEGTAPMDTDLLLEQESQEVQELVDFTPMDEDTEDIEQDDGRLAGSGAPVTQEQDEPTEPAVQGHSCSPSPAGGPVGGSASLTNDVGNSSKVMTQGRNIPDKPSEAEKSDQPAKEPPRKVFQRIKGRWKRPPTYPREEPQLRKQRSGLEHGTSVERIVWRPPQPLANRQEDPPTVQPPRQPTPSVPTTPAPNERSSAPRMPDSAAPPSRQVRQGNASLMRAAPPLPSGAAPHLPHGTFYPLSRMPSFPPLQPLHPHTSYQPAWAGCSYQNQQQHYSNFNRNVSHHIAPTQQNIHRYNPIPSPPLPPSPPPPPPSPPPSPTSDRGFSPPISPYHGQNTRRRSVFSEEGQASEEYAHCYESGSQTPPNSPPASCQTSDSSEVSDVALPSLTLHPCCWKVQAAYQKLLKKERQKRKLYQRKYREYCLVKSPSRKRSRGVGQDRVQKSSHRRRSRCQSLGCRAKTPQPSRVVESKEGRRVEKRRAMSIVPDQYRRREKNNYGNHRSNHPAESSYHDGRTSHQLRKRPSSSYGGQYESRHSDRKPSGNPQQQYESHRQLQGPKIPDSGYPQPTYKLSKYINSANGVYVGQSMAHNQRQQRGIIVERDANGWL